MLNNQYQEHINHNQPTYWVASGYSGATPILSTQAGFVQQAQGQNYDKNSSSEDKAKIAKLNATVSSQKTRVVVNYNAENFRVQYKDQI